MIPTSNKILTFVDASVLIRAALQPTATTFYTHLRALQILGDPDREFVGREFLRLEVLPIANYFGKRREIKFYEKFFDNVAYWANDVAVIAPALALASQYGLGALDALHLCAANQFGAEFVSAEKPTKGIYRAYSNISTIY